MNHALWSFSPCRCGFFTAQSDQKSLFDGESRRNHERGVPAHAASELRPEVLELIKPPGVFVLSYLNLKHRRGQANINGGPHLSSRNDNHINISSSISKNV
jgi:hypothetical protein